MQVPVLRILRMTHCLVCEEEGERSGNKTLPKATLTLLQQMKVLWKRLRRRSAGRWRETPRTHTERHTAGRLEEEVMKERMGGAATNSACDED